MKNLPIGLQFLSEFAETNSIYIDKTRLVHQPKIHFARKLGADK